jgi:hypothetical protein
MMRWRSPKAKSVAQHEAQARCLARLWADEGVSVSELSDQTQYTPNTIRSLIAVGLGDDRDIVEVNPGKKKSYL